MRKTMNNFVGEELANKVKILTKALSQAELIISKLEQENRLLLDALNNLTSINKEDCEINQEVVCV